LTIDAAAMRENQNIELVCRFGGQQRLSHGGFGRLSREILIHGATVNGNLPFAGAQEHPRHGGLPPAGPQMLH
jgi:hypothetical protein